MPSDNREYSPQSTEIFGKMPHWIIRWGMSVIFLIFAGLIAGSYLLKYPQIVVAPITITTINPPTDLIAKTTGRIDTIFAKEGATIHQDEVVAMLQNSTKYQDANNVLEHIENFDPADSNSWIEQNYSMGELQSPFSEFRTQYLNYQHYIKADNIGKKRRLLERQTEQYKTYLRQLTSQRGLIKRDYEYTLINFRRDSALYADRVISSLEYERSAQAKLQKESAMASYEASLTTTELTVMQMEQQLLELDLQYDNETTTYKNQINESRTRLLAQIRQWQQNYLLISPIVGRLSFAKFWSSNQHIQAGEKLATIIPADSSEVVGIMEVPSAGFGRVAVGQTVNVKLNGFPYFEYGLLKGVVNRISSVPEKDGYIVEVTFPQGLQSTYKEQLQLIQRMDGTGDIITRDQRLIQRFIQPLRAFFDK